MKRLCMILAALICLPILAFAVSEETTGASAPSGAEEKAVSTLLQVIRNNPEELRAFFLSMPKGGDIHNHLTGAVYAEDLIDAASSERLCIYSNNYTVTNALDSKIRYR